ncbi:MAG: 16S rRNA (cytidine(1402)-2'-O)-methyltransferase [Parcubacteria group bacterium CG10_big_fil_rev_8_21_14_0_10_38_31]|nr:MAG: 16S rRNA (cytidine(1402)-2'-O)-methyltransferase [Parcubacteria group bacterium CG10_big_fil_rev_8_21_14_0_10_38_31]
MIDIGTLYIIATPIGNLSDITLRALETLKEVDFILCEDTRVTKKLLSHYDINKPLLSYHQHSKLSKIDKIAELLEGGKNLALVSDAGTPGVSDPGNELIARLLEQPNLINSDKNVKIIPIPGPSSVLTLLSVSGIDVSKFLFLGFLPHKKGRKTLIEKIKESEYPVVVFESKHRLLKLLNEFKESDSYIVVGRELTKMFEEILRGDANEICEYFEKNPGKLKGEFVVIFSKKM